MNDRITAFVKKSIWVAIGLFVVRYLICPFESLYDGIGAVGEVIGVTTIVMSLYNAFFWQYMPFEKTPRLMGDYTGFIEYDYDGVIGKKDTTVVIEQTLLTVKVKLITDEITSYTITGNIIEENSKYVLYYTYIKNPKSKYSKENPIQYGTARIVIDQKDELIGTYWTSSKTIGDIELTKLNKK